jgi:hypothetical protein
LINAFNWADSTEGVIAVLSPEAQDRFISWRNKIAQSLPVFPELFKGFIPKAWGYALRLAGALHLLDRFSKGLEPCKELSLLDIERGIVAAEYYLGQALDALKLIVGPKGPTPITVSVESHMLAQVLDRLRGQMDDGRLAVKFITENYNDKVEESEHLTPRRMGDLLRKCGLPTAERKFDANGQKRARCLVWTDAVEAFIKKGLLAHNRELNNRNRLTELDMLSKAAS